MPDIALFVEDFAHQQFISALLGRLAREYSISLTLDWRNARRGHGAVTNELKQFLRDIQRGCGELPELVIVATDANCKGLNQRTKQIGEVTDKSPSRVVLAIPDPHIERWLLVDSAAFKMVFGRGCSPPDQKCERARYKKMLIDAIRATGVTPSLGGIEFSEDLVKAMDLDRTSESDPSFKKFLTDLRSIFKEWHSR